MAYVRKHPEFKDFRMKVGKMPDFTSDNLIQQEELLGTIDGENRIFKLKNKAFVGSESIYKDGLHMKRGEKKDFSDGDYTINYFNKTIVFSPSQTPQPGAMMHCSYRRM